MVNVTDMLDAQNQTFGADQLAIAAIYEHLIDLVELQRAIAWFEEDKTPAENDLFVEQIEAAVEAEESGMTAQPGAEEN